MLNLTLKEQKEILGGRWKVTIFNPDDTTTIAYFGNEEYAREWGKRNSWGLKYTVEEV
jgi:hypothetical protein